METLPQPAPERAALSTTVTGNVVHAWMDSCQGTGGRGEAASLEQQLSRAKEQLKSALAAMSDMVSRAELFAARARCEDAEAIAKANSDQQQAALQDLNGRLAAMQKKNEQLIDSIQVDSKPRVVRYVT